MSWICEHIPSHVFSDIFPSISHDVSIRNSPSIPHEYPVNIPPNYFPEWKNEWRNGQTTQTRVHLCAGPRRPNKTSLFLVKTFKHRNRLQWRAKNGPSSIHWNLHPLDHDFHRCSRIFSDVHWISIFSNLLKGFFSVRDLEGPWSKTPWVPQQRSCADPDTTC